MSKKNKEDELVAVNVKIRRSMKEKLDAKAAAAFRNFTQEVRLALENHTK